jgi:hypothetical protein
VVEGIPVAVGLADALDVGVRANTELAESLVCNVREGADVDKQELGKARLRDDIEDLTAGLNHLHT